ECDGGGDGERDRDRPIGHPQLHPLDGAAGFRHRRDGTGLLALCAGQRDKHRHRGGVSGTWYGRDRVG
ncbi:hypothetical protein, partial [Pseudomonas sp. EA_65y_Pfl1_P113]|uniref:hypothetical protein n=1 Tax=Pseudomonas sp. EA_65y_Pfl1_P113 TaxID=3088692 RepID=UPI0030DA05EB